jgi:alginate O-acetyltransferase complex protein AlgI
LTQLVGYTLAFLLCLAIFARARSRVIRQATLLIASYALYVSWGAWFAAVLVTSTVINFLVGRTLRRRPSGFILLLGIAFNLALLIAFKYLPEASVHLPFSSLQQFAHLAMPLGISFWTFQAMSYLFDLYQGEEMDPTFGEFALYMVFFPVTISGPVCRLPEMLPQLRSEEGLHAGEISRGLRRIATGVLMMQVAKLLGQGILAADGINSGFDRVTRWSGPDAWCLAFGYGLQLLFDFAGYSHIAIGAAQALGISLPENFRRPFDSTSPSVFWTRWHMSLSFWIRDCVFFPLMQMRREMWWRNLCLVISMTLFGLWHKASLLFLIWGLYHGVLLVMHRQIEAAERKYDWNPPEPLWSAVSWITTMALMNLGWIFFRAKSLGQVRLMLSAVLSPATYGAHFLSGSLYFLVLSVALGYAAVLLVHDRIDRRSEAMIERERAPDSEPIPSQELCPSRFGDLIVQWRWFWITPLYCVALLLLLIVTSSQGTSTAQLMYGNF